MDTSRDSDRGWGDGSHRESILGLLRMKTHKSHISSGEAKSRGWSRIPSSAIQQETRKQEVGSEYMKGDYLILNATNSNINGSTITSGYATSTDSTAASGVSYYYPYQTWTDDWNFDTNVATLNEIVKEKGVTLNERTLFKVYVVDPKKNGKILLDGKLVIAVNENQAMLKVGVGDIAANNGLELEQVDVYVQTIGTFIRPRKETQRVKITKEEDD